MDVVGAPWVDHHPMIVGAERLLSVAQPRAAAAFAGRPSSVARFSTQAGWSDLRASAPVYLEDVNNRGVVMLVTRHHDQSQFSRYFYPWRVVGWIRLAEEDERSKPRSKGS